MTLEKIIDSRIDKAKITKQLDLSDLPLKAVPEGVFQLKDLKTLDLSGTGIYSMQEFKCIKEELLELEHLYLDDKQLAIEGMNEIIITDPFDLL